jgi:hypothetical protein
MQDEMPKYNVVRAKTRAVIRYKEVGAAAQQNKRKERGDALVEPTNTFGT